MDYTGENEKSKSRYGSAEASALLKIPIDNSQAPLYILSILEQSFYYRTGQNIDDTDYIH